MTRGRVRFRDTEGTEYVVMPGLCACDLWHRENSLPGKQHRYYDARTSNAAKL